MTVDREAVRSFSCFSAIADWEAAAVSQVLTVRQYPAGEIVIRQGDLGSTLSLLVEGEAEIYAQYNGYEGRLAIVAPGGIFGEIGLLLDIPRSASVRTLTSATVWELTRAAFESSLTRGDSWAIKLQTAIAHVLARRLAEVDDQLLRLLSASRNSPHADLESLRGLIFGEWNY